MIEDDKIYKEINGSGVTPPSDISQYSPLKKILWILKTAKDNSPANALSPKAISYLAYKILEEKISERSILNIIAPAKDVIMKNYDNFYEITRKGREKLEEREDSNNSFEERIYDENSPFDFHNDLRDIINLAKRDIFIIEPYIDEDLLEITLRKINNLLDIKILTNQNNPKGKFVKVSNKFISQHKGKFEARETDKIHDRGIFIDGKDGWVIGQSLGQGGKKPTYIKKLLDSKKLESIYQKIWNFSTKVK